MMSSKAVQGTSLSVRGRAGARSAPRAAHTRQLAVCAAAKKKVLIVNTNGGGHANIGFQLAKKLLADGHEVTMNVVGTQDDKKMNKAPFTYFDQLTSAGGKTVWNDPADVASVGGSFDVVVDNNGKDMGAVGPVIEFAKAAGAEQFLFVSSCGVYTPMGDAPHIEGDDVKATAGHVVVENELAASGMSWSSFRPQYITGYGSNKDCEEWFFDRLVRGRDIPVPGDGTQRSTVSVASDLGGMMAAAVGNEAARGEVFNCVSCPAVTLDGMVAACAKAAGVSDYNIVHWDYKAMADDAPVKKAFPFRPVPFFATYTKAMETLGWAPEETLEGALAARFEEYKASGRADKAMEFPLDDTILAASK